MDAAGATVGDGPVSPGRSRPDPEAARLSSLLPNLAAAGATNLPLVTFLIPPVAILLGPLVLGEHLLPRHLGGMVLIGLGLVLADGRIARLRRPAE